MVRRKPSNLGLARNLFGVWLTCSVVSFFHHDTTKTTVHQSTGFRVSDHTVGCVRDADKSLARPGRKQATATEDFDVHVSYL